MTLFSGLHEAFVKYADYNRVGYFDSAEKALAALAEDTKYQAAWFSLNTAPGVPANFQLNRLYRPSSRYRKTDYKGRQLLLVDADPKRGADTSATDEQKAAALRQIHDVRDFLRNLGFPDPVLSDSGNGYHLLYRLDEPNDEATETLIKNLLAGLAAKFNNEESTIDGGTSRRIGFANFMAPGRARVAIRDSGGNPRSWRFRRMRSNCRRKKVGRGRWSRKSFLRRSFALRWNPRWRNCPCRVERL